MKPRTAIAPAAEPAQAAGRTAGSVQVGMFAPSGLLELGPETARAFLAQAGQESIDHACYGDHVSFAGLGFDGLVQATALATLHPTLPVYSGVYLLPLRHPVLVARQLADIARLAPGRLIFGVGIGGEDRHEVAICGVDPATRGPRMEPRTLSGVFKINNDVPAGRALACASATRRARAAATGGSGR